MHGLVHVVRTELASHAGQSRPERKYLDPSTPDNCGVGEADEDPGVGFHRAAHIEQQHQAASTSAGCRARQADGFAFGAHRSANRSAQVVAGSSAVWHSSTRRTLGRCQPHPSHDPLGFEQLGFGEFGEVLLPQHLRCAVAKGEVFVTTPLAFAIAGSLVDSQRC